MKRFREEFRACNNDGFSVNATQNNIRSLEQVAFPRLNLPLTKSAKFINEIESILQQHHTSTRPEVPKNPEKLKAVNFPISKITIGEWTRDAVYPDDLKAKFYFAKKKFMWECLDSVETQTTKTTRMKRKIEFKWADVLSLKPVYHPHDETGILKVELRKAPTFFMETNPKPGKHTLWQHMDQDFTLNQSASRNRIHTLHFAPGILQKNMEKLVSGDKFWSELIKVPFPTLQDLYFDIDYGNSNNNFSINPSRCSHVQTLSFNVNNDLHHHHSQGFRRPRVEEANFNMAMQFCPNYGMQIHSYVQGYIQNSTMNQLPGTHVIQPSSQLITEHFPASQFYKYITQDMSQMENTRELLGSQAFADTLLETQTNSIDQHVNEPSLVYPQFVGPYDGSLPPEEDRQNIHFDANQINGNQHIDFDANQFDGNQQIDFDANFQINGNQQIDFDANFQINDNQQADFDVNQINGNQQIDEDFQQSSGFDDYQYNFSSNIGSVFPDMDIEDILNGKGL